MVALHGTAPGAERAYSTGLEREHVAQKWVPVLRSSDMRNQDVRVGRVNANERETLWVVMPADSMDIWIIFRHSGASEPNSHPADPAPMIGGIALDASIARIW